jgi:hypothetical protein
VVHAHRVAPGGHGAREAPPGVGAVDHRAAVGPDDREAGAGHPRAARAVEHDPGDRGGGRRRPVERAPGPPLLLVAEELERALPAGREPRGEGGHADVPARDEPQPVGQPLELQSSADLRHVARGGEVRVAVDDVPQLRRGRVDPQRAGDVHEVAAPPHGAEREPDEPRVLLRRAGGGEAVVAEEDVGEEHARVGRVVRLHAVRAPQVALLRQRLGGRHDVGAVADADLHARRRVAQHAQPVVEHALVAAELHERGAPLHRQLARGERLPRLGPQVRGGGVARRVGGAGAAVHHAHAGELRRAAREQHGEVARPPRLQLHGERDDGGEADALHLHPVRPRRRGAQRLPPVGVGEPRRDARAVGAEEGDDGAGDRGAAVALDDAHAERLRGRGGGEA